MNLMIAVPIFNRKKYLEITAHSLKECSDVNNVEISVFDDASTEFDLGYLKNVFNFGNTKIITRNPGFKSADKHTYQIMLDFLNTDNDVLMICDSDLLLRPDTIDYIYKNFDKTDGFLSTYNSELHKNLYCDGEFVYKQDVGFAGICISRRLLSKFIDKQKSQPRSMDFKLSKFLIDNNVRLLVPEHSLVQHIGFDGQNCGNTSVEFASNFIPLSDFNKKIINELMPVVVKMQSEMIKHLLFNDKYRRHGFMIHQPHKYFFEKKRNKQLIKYYAAKYPNKSYKGVETCS